MKCESWKRPCQFFAVHTWLIWSDLHRNRLSTDSLNEAHESKRWDRFTKKLCLPGTNMTMAVCTAFRMMLSRANIQWGLMLWFRRTLLTCRNITSYSIVCDDLLSKSQYWAIQYQMAFTTHFNFVMWPLQVKKDIQWEICIHQELVRWLWLDAHRILEAEERHLQLADSCAVEVELQFELREGAGDDFPVCHPHKISQTCHQCGDMLMLQFGLLRALYWDTKSALEFIVVHTSAREPRAQTRDNSERCSGWPVSAPPAGEARSSLCPRSGFGVKSPSSHCLSSAWRNQSLSPLEKVVRCGPQSSPQEYYMWRMYRFTKSRQNKSMAPCNLIGYI